MVVMCYRDILLMFQCDHDTCILVFLHVICSIICLAEFLSLPRLARVVRYS